MWNCSRIINTFSKIHIYSPNKASLLGYKPQTHLKPIICNQSLPTVWSKVCSSVITLRFSLGGLLRPDALFGHRSVWWKHCCISSGGLKGLGVGEEEPQLLKCRGLWESWWQSFFRPYYKTNPNEPPLSQSYAAARTSFLHEGEEII